MARKNILIVDGNNALARYTHAYPEAENVAGEPIGGIYGMVHDIQRQITQNAYDVVVAAFDDGVPAWRMEMAPVYKQQRAASRNEKQEEIHRKYKAQQPVAWRALVPAGVHTCRVPGCEADDAIAVLALKRFSDHCVTILSSDKDFTALATQDGRVNVYDPINQVPRLPDHTYMLKRCLDPKGSDNLDGVGGIGPKKADELVDSWLADTRYDDPMWQPGALDSFLGWCAKQPQDRLDSKKQVKPTNAGAVIAEQQNVRVNFKVTNLHESANRYETNLKWRKGKPDSAAFLAIVKELNLKPLHEQFSVVWKTFARLEPLP